MASVDGCLLEHKVLTTAVDPARGALNGLDELVAKAAVDWADVDELVHGTTLVTNALIARIGAKTALLTTKGFRDVLAFGRQQRYNAYDLRIGFPVELVERELRVEIDERTLANGEVYGPVNTDEVRTKAERLVGQGVEAIAICFMHSYINPQNETDAAALLRKEFPGLTVVASHEVAPLIGEYERVMTTCASAYTSPLVRDYLAKFDKGLSERQFGGRFLLMQSSGGTAGAESVAAAPIRLLESGPAGGVRGAGHVAQMRDEASVLGFDMGGTTAKACVLESGRFQLSDVLEVARVEKFTPGSGMPVYVPTVDLIEIGAGGGSIAAVDRLGFLQVGPESAVGDPGPACYGFGGEDATVTDADLVLGYISPTSFLDGKMPLHKEAAEQAIQRMGQLLALDLAGTAVGIRRVVNENMASAARMHMVEHDRDPRKFVLVASGGAGPVHAADVARLLGMRRVVVPMNAGVLSASGFLLAPSSYEASMSKPSLFDDIDWSAIQSVFKELEREALQVLSQSGADPVEVRTSRSVEMKLLGQVHSIEVPIHELGQGLLESFLSTYKEKYKLVPPNMPAEVLTWRVRCTAPSPAPRDGLVAEMMTASSESHNAGDSRLAWFDGRFMKCAIYTREGLAGIGKVVRGPALIEDADTTTVVGPGDNVSIDAHGNVIVDLGVER